MISPAHIHDPAVRVALADLQATFARMDKAFARHVEAARATPILNHPGAHDDGRYSY